MVILSAHQDSTNSLPFLRAPGAGSFGSSVARPPADLTTRADDDGSGTTVLLTILGSLLAEGYSANKDTAVEFHFYSAEEGEAGTRSAGSSR